MEELSPLLEEARQAIQSINDADSLEKIRVHYLGKKGLLTEYLKNLKELSPEEKRTQGQALNQAKEDLVQWLKHAQARVEKASLLEKSGETIDVTLPGRGQLVGNLHPISQTLARVEAYFTKRGFEIAEGPEIETDYYNFEALNFPLLHPSRASHDTFYFPDGRLLRTHTSPVQIRCLEKQKPPVQMIASGRVYRCDYDATHLPMFHQTEGLMIGKKISFAHLKGILNDFLKYFFEQDIKSRFRPSFFPFVEPGAEVDMQCILCKGEGCRVCKHTGWLEILGCGMVHPNVLKMCHIDPEEWTGFAFGVGIERLAMIRHRIDDIRLFCENDYRFLKQF